MKYSVIRSKRKTIALQIMADGSLLVRCPVAMGTAEIDTFVESKKRWINKHLSKTARGKLPAFTEEDLREMAGKARIEIPPMVAYYANLLGVSYGNITVRKQRTRWGSCSSKGNLNFNCLLMQMPKAVLVYVIVHELCHRKHMNHSKAFWAEVERILPDYKEAKKWLKENGNAFISRI